MATARSSTSRATTGKTQWSRARMDQYPMVEYTIQSGITDVMTSVKKHLRRMVDNQPFLVQGTVALEAQKVQAAMYH